MALRQPVTIKVDLREERPHPWPQVYLCVALTTLATLLLELSLTRIFSVVFYYHFAFLAISIALFGLGHRRRILVRGGRLEGAALRQARTAQRRQHVLCRCWR